MNKQGTQANVVNDNFKKNRVVAHRGAWKQIGAAENSIASLKHAVQIGCEASEFDVHMSADSVLFVHHDELIQGMKIEESTSTILRRLRLGNGEPLPTLNEYLTEGMQQQQTKLLLEIKGYQFSKDFAISVTQKVLNLVHEQQAEPWVDYISFDYGVCKELIKHAGSAKVSYLNGDKSPAELAADHFYGLDYQDKVLRSQPTWIQEARSYKLNVNVWTVNEEADMRFFLDEGVDLITTDEPERLLKMFA